ncbi:hypothetical protein LOZ65_002667 [Ophidiomyces ophidiicola]|nr:hypothetical protein LOZ65_002667 [Ophidiomyces ophidiicola]
MARSFAHSFVHLLLLSGSVLGATNSQCSVRRPQSVDNPSFENGDKGWTLTGAPSGGKVVTKDGAPDVKSR